MVTMACGLWWHSVLGGESLAQGLVEVRCQGHVTPLIYRCGKNETASGSRLLMKVFFSDMYNHCTINSVGAPQQ